MDISIVDSGLEKFCSIMCEHIPTNAKDSGQPEWSRGELEKAFNELVKNGIIKEV